MAAVAAFEHKKPFHVKVPTEADQAKTIWRNTVVDFAFCGSAY